MENNFAKNLKYIRESKKMSQQEMAEKIGVDRSTIGYWENEKADPTMQNVCKIAEIFDISLISLIGNKIDFDNAEYIDVFTDTIQIPVLGVIKAGIPIEAQQDILEYVDIPKSWINGNKSFYGLKISGDSMYPEYNENDIVIFEQTEDYAKAQKKDCAVMVNGYDATFKNVTISESGITLVPLNINNSEGYTPTFYNKEEIQNLPVKIVGIAKEIRRRK